MRRQPKTITNQRGRSTRTPQTGVELKNNNKKIQKPTTNWWQKQKLKIYHCRNIYFLIFCSQACTISKAPNEILFIDNVQCSLKIISNNLYKCKQRPWVLRVSKELKNNYSEYQNNHWLLDKQLQELFSPLVCFLIAKILVSAFLIVHRKCFLHSI